MDPETSYDQVGDGWHDLVETFWKMVDILSTRAYIDVVEVGHRMGMLNIKTKTDDAVVQDMLDRLAWSLERDSATICEVCGGKGFRRKSLPGSPNRCREHYLILANEMAERGDI